MAQMTLLQIVQDILNDIDGDMVNSIDDTIESTQVAQIVQSTYFALMTVKNWPHLRRLIQLTPSTSLSLPTYMSLPEPITELVQVQYDCRQLSDGARAKYLHIKWREPEDFLLYTNNRISTAGNIITCIDPTSNATILIRNDIAPTFYTSFDDNTIIFDSYDSSIDNTLQQNKTQCIAYMQPTWVQSDSAIPNIPAEAFTLLLEEAKSRAAVKLRQLADNKAEQESERQRAWLSRKDWRVHGGIKFMNYGRKGYKNERDPTFRHENGEN
jgi:hypothetical protein